MMAEYEWEIQAQRNPEKDIESWTSNFGPVVTKRDERGNAKKAKFQLLTHNDEQEVYLTGSFTDWEMDPSKLKEYRLEKDNYGNFHFLEKEIKHLDKYKFLVKEKDKVKLYQDPAGHYYDHDGNTVFWDFERPEAYKMKHPIIDTRNRPTKIMQTDLPGLIAHFKSKDGRLGQDVDPEEYYKFIARSGIVQKVKELGFNTIQFLPFAQSIDGDNWKYRYLVPFQYGIQKNWGNPDDFKEMIDAFHAEGIAVIGDFVLGHLPFKDYKIFAQDAEDNGIHCWKKSNGHYTYLHEETHWGTIRLDYDNPLIREFFIGTCLHFLKHYKIDGFRIDNVDGIIRYGESGGGDERPNGRTFLRELNSAIYKYNPRALIHFEAHYFFEDNAKLLVTPLDQDERALGATAYNSSRMTYYFHKDYMLKSADKITAWRFKHISEEKEWGQSNSTVADFHNHDAAAGLMAERATGSYAYDTMTVKAPENHVHAVGKIKVMEALISFFAEGRTLDLIQSFLLQTGTFEHDSSIRWYLEFNQVSKNLVHYKRKVNEIMDDPAFHPENTGNREFLNVDDKNKILVVERSSKKSRYVIVVNLTSWRHFEYKIGVKTKSDYKLVLSSDLFEYSGFGLSSHPNVFENKSSDNFEVLEREIHISSIAPYEVLIFKEK